MSVCNTSHVGGVTVLAKVPRLSRHQKEILRTYILKQRKEKAQEGKEGVCWRDEVESMYIYISF